MRVVLIAVVALVLAGAASAASEAPSLEPAASWVAGKPVRVVCTPAAAGGETDAVGGSEIRLNPIVCTALLTRLGRQYVDLPTLAASLRVLAHEAMHASGLQDESATDCSAIQHVPGMASRFFGFKTWRSRHSLMAFVWLSHGALPARYRTVC